jgi:hypothetical protein
MNPSTHGLMGLIPVGTRITGAFSLRDGKCKRVDALCSFCDEPAEYMVAARYYPEHYDLLCAKCVTRGLAEGWYPYGVRIRKVDNG